MATIIKILMGVLWVLVSTLLDVVFKKFLPVVTSILGKIIVALVKIAIFLFMLVVVERVEALLTRRFVVVEKVEIQ